ncbi:Predicted amidohydrolase [Auraticoccus monumenti]|uniref:Predicted amidohydrolase n=1 Tax=Auraticoccus monumenti TaxID=675864 RepID=A0A1G6V336_9ACTN|nr:Predicted amidohydrolase [Auraticoccus monumenti]
MTANSAFKRRVRARAARTGESYTAALRHLRSVEGALVTRPTDRPVRLRIAVAQTTHRDDPADAAGVAANGAEVRALMERARGEGADLIHLPEATLCFPSKRRLSSTEPELGEADWDRFAWDALTAELREVAATAARLGLWTVVGAQHRLSGPTRPHTSLYVIGPDGSVVTRYDERVLSHTKETLMYTPGHRPVVVDVGGVRLGLASGLEVHFPHLFAGYAEQDVHGVLFSTAGPGEPDQAATFAREARALASQYSLWMGYAAPSSNAPWAPSGLIDPHGRWVARCAAQVEPDVAVGDLVHDPADPGRRWRRSLRGRTGPTPVEDPRSVQHTTF